MGKFAKQSILTTVFSYLGVLVGYFNLLWLFPYVLEPDQIGLIRTIQDMALLLVPFAQLGIANGITRFFPHLKPQKFAFLTFSLTISFSGFLLMLVLFFLFRESIISAFAQNSPEVNRYFQVALLITFILLMSSIFESFCRSFLKVSVPSFIRDVLLRLFLLFLVLGYYLALYEFNTLVYALVIVYSLSLLVLLFYMYRSGILAFSLKWSGISWDTKKSFLSYSVITLLGTAGAILIMKIDSLMVSSMIGLEANAIYTIAFSIAVVIEMPRRAVSQIAMPVISEKFAEGALEDIHLLYKKIATHQTFICLLIFLLIWVNIDVLYYFVPNNQVYQAGKWVVFLIGMGKLSDVLFSVNGEIIVFSRFYLFNITATLIMCVAVVVLNLLLIPLLGIEGAALASFLAMGLYNLLKYIYVKFRLGFDPFTWPLGGIVLSGVLSWLLGDHFMPKPENIWLRLFITSGSVGTIYVLGNYWMNTLPELKDSLFEKIKNWRK